MRTSPVKHSMKLADQITDHEPGSRQLGFEQACGFDLLRHKSIMQGAETLQTRAWLLAFPSCLSILISTGVRNAEMAGVCAPVHPHGKRTATCSHFLKVLIICFFSNVVLGLSVPFLCCYYYYFFHTVRPRTDVDRAGRILN